MVSKRILIIAGLTLAIEMKRRGFDPLVVEKAPGLRREGYMMDFFGTGWDVAARMSLIEMKIPHDNRIGFLRDQYHGSGWITQNVLRAYTGEDPVFFNSVTQIVMPQWHKGRVALIGDACGCLTLLAGQGSHMAMGGGYVLAEELPRQNDHQAAFAAYQNSAAMRTEHRSEP